VGLYAGKVRIAAVYFVPQPWRDGCPRAALLRERAVTTQKEVNRMNDGSTQQSLPGLATYVPRLQALPLRERPAYRVGHKGPDACAAHELLAAVIGGAKQLEAAEALLARYESLSGIANAAAEELARVDGVGPAKAAAIQAALALGRRMVLESWKERDAIRSPSDVAQLLMAEMGHLEQEHLRVLYLDTRNRLLGSETVYVGTLNSSHVRVGEVFRDAVRRNCAAIIVVHNHPSGDPSPSPEDREVTRQLVEAGELLDVELLDHLVIGCQRFVSMRERGLGFK
jgi:DNA repair protein RadC